MRSTDKKDFILGDRDMHRQPELEGRDGTEGLCHKKDTQEIGKESCKGGNYTKSPLIYSLKTQNETLKPVLPYQMERKHDTGMH